MPQQRGLHGLIVGVDSYATGISSLQSAVADASAIADLLARDHGYRNHVLVDAAATADAIYYCLEEQLPAQIDDGDAFFFYFAGHGIARGDGADGPQGYLLASDAVANDETSWLSMVRIRRALDALSCNHLMVVLDCCFAGTFRWASTRDALLTSARLYDSQYERFLRGTAWQALTSASHDQLALDVSPGRTNTRDQGSGGRHSPFAAALMKGLRGDADSSRGRHAPDGVITATELFQFVFDELVPAQAESFQTPGLWPLKPENSGEYIFLNPNQPRNTKPDPPLDDTNNPWLGLSIYAADQQNLFFGRERVVDEIVSRVQRLEHRLHVVVGASGTGKSSVLNAGVLPRLTTGNGDALASTWRVVRAPRLNAHPERQLQALTVQLPSASAATRILVVMDQFEELYTQCSDETLRTQFRRELLDLLRNRPDVSILLSLRSDFEPRPANAEEFAALWGQARYVVPALSIEEFREIVEGPAQVKAIYFEPANLVDELLNEVMAMPGALPLLSFALSEIYRRAQQRRRETGSHDRALTLDDYNAAGGVVGALHQRASQLYDGADPDTQRTTRTIFLRMLSQDGARLTRRRVADTELQFEGKREQQRVEEVLERYINARLLVADEGYVEPAHDTLVTAWERLQIWLSEHGSLDLQRAVWRATEEWDGHGRTATLLWHDDHRLASAQHDMAELNAHERVFVTASLRKRHRRRVVSVAATVALVAVLAGATWYSQNQATIAKQQSAEADRQRNAALKGQSLFLADLARQEAASGNTTNAIVLALEALPGSSSVPERPYAVEAEAQLYNALPNHREVAALEGHEGRVTFATFSPDGSTVVTAAHDRTARLWDVAQRKEIAVLAGHSSRVPHAAFSPDGRFIVSVQIDGGIRHWHAATGEFIKAIPLADESTYAVYFHPDSKKVLTVGYEPGVGGLGRIIDLESGRQLHLLAASSQQSWAVTQGAFSPDGRYAVTGDRASSAVLWDVPSGRQRHVLGHGQGLYYTTFSPDSSRVLTASADTTARVWNAQSGELQNELSGHTGKVFHAEFSPDQDTIVTVSADRTARLWSAEDGRQLHVLRGHQDEVRHAAFSHDGQQLITSSRDDKVRVWDVESGAPKAILGAHTADVTHAQFDPNDKFIVSTGGRQAHLWRAKPTGLVKKSPDHDRWVAFSDLSPDGSRLATIDGGWIESFNRTAALIDVTSESRIAVLSHDSAFITLAFCAGGDLLVTQHANGDINLWHGISGAKLLSLRGKLEDYVACSNDGAWLAHGPAGDLTAEAPGSLQALPGAPEPSATGTPPFPSEWTLLPRKWRSADGFSLMTRGREPTIRDLRNDKVVTLRGHDGRIFHVDFSPDGTLIATASGDGKVRLWARESGLLLHTLTGHEDQVNWVEFSPNGARLVSASGKMEYTFNARDLKIANSEDDTARVWDVASGRQIAVLSGHNEHILHARFSRDSNHVITGSGDGTARVWTLFANTQELIDYAQRRVTRQLTDEQRRAFFLD